MSIQGQSVTPEENVKYRPGKLVLLQGEMYTKQVTQQRLADIKVLQARIALLKNELQKQWESVRVDAIHGATFEPGPVKAYVTSQSYFTRGRIEKTRTILRVL
jgi:hypothetical protein